MGDDDDLTPSLSGALLKAGLALTVVLIILVAATTWAISSAVSGTDTKVLTNREAGFKNRAAVCSILAASDGKSGLPAICLERDVVRYYNPNQVPSASPTARQEYNTKLLCRILDAPPSCTHVPGG